MGRAAAELVGEDEPTVEEELRAKIAALEAENATLKTKPEKKKSTARSEKMKKYRADERAKHDLSNVLVVHPRAYRR